MLSEDLEFRLLLGFQRGSKSPHSSKQASMLFIPCARGANFSILMLTHTRFPKATGFLGGTAHCAQNLCRPNLHSSA